MKKKVMFSTTLATTLNHFAANQIMKLVEMGLEVDVACSDPQNLSQDIVDHANPITIRVTRGSSIRYLLTSIIDYFKAFSSKDYDMVIYATPNASFSCSLAARIKKIKSRLYCQWGIRYVGFSGIKRKTFKLIEKITCMNSTEIEPISKSNRHFGITERLYTDSKSDVIGLGGTHGVSLKRFNPNNRLRFRSEMRAKYNINDHTIVFGFIGRVTRDKGINELFNSFFKLHDLGMCVKLLIVGEVEKTYSSKFAQKNRGIYSDSIIHIGQTSSVEEYYSMMDVFVFPTYREGFGQVALEAQAMGLPIISTRVNGPIDSTIDGQTSILVEPENVNELSDAMVLLYENEELRRSMGDSGAIHVSKNYESSSFMKCLVEKRIIQLNRAT